MYIFLRFNVLFSRIDATKDDGRLGRLVNDSFYPNSTMKIINGYHGEPHLCLFALHDINVNEEIFYSYGVGELPWHKQVF